MKLAVFSDVHANPRSLQAVLADCEKRGVDMVLCLGDLVGFSPRPKEVIDIVRKEGIECVLGNHDRLAFDPAYLDSWPICNPEEKNLLRLSLNFTNSKLNNKEKEYLSSLPDKIIIEYKDYRLIAVHGSIGDPNRYLHKGAPKQELLRSLEDQNFHVLLCGHTHIYYQEWYGGKGIVNVGSTGKPKHGDPYAVYALVTLTSFVTVDFVKVTYDWHTAAQEVLEAGLGEATARWIAYGNLQGFQIQ